MIIRKGQHYSFALPRLMWAPDVITKRVTFTPSCAYDIGVEQGDVNKLFGIGYFPHHHRNSVRFGWRWSLVSSRVEVLIYAYASGQRIIQPMCSVDIGDAYLYTIRNAGGVHVLSVAGETRVVQMDDTILAYQLNPYFGGNLPAPHDIEIDIA